MVGDHYEVKVDGAWMPVPRNKINNVIAPDGGAHVCAPKQEGVNKGVLFCVILPPDGWGRWTQIMGRWSSKAPRIHIAAGRRRGSVAARGAQQGGGSPLIGDHPIFATGGLWKSK
jgi:hypothetical protein